MTSKHDRLIAMVSELDDRGFSPSQIANSIQLPLDRVTDLLDEIDAIPTQVITAETEPPTMSLAVELEWAEPPAPNSRGPRRSAAIDAIVAELQRNPGRWAAVARDQRTGSGHATWKKRGVEAVSRPQERAEGAPARWTIYARWPVAL